MFLHLSSLLTLGSLLLYGENDLSKNVDLSNVIDAAHAFSNKCEVDKFASQQNEQNIPILSLEEVIQMALAHNLDLSIDRLEPEIARTSIERAKAFLDPAIFLKTDRKEKREAQANSELEGAKYPTAETRFYSASVRKLLRTGGDIELGTSLKRRSSNSSFDILQPDNDSEIFFAFRQPLLKNAGPTVTLAPIQEARFLLKRSQLQLQRDIILVLAETEIHYWSLAYARTQRQFRSRALNLAENILQETQERHRIGLADHLDILQAEAALASRQQDVILAEQAVLKAEDELRLILGLLKPEKEHLVLGVGSLPRVDFGDLDYSLFLKQSLDCDWDTMVQKQLVEEKKLQSRVASKQKLPSLDIILGGGYLGSARKGAKAYSNTYKAHGHRWNAGIELLFPWGLREVSARDVEARKTLEREELRLEKTKQAFLFLVRDTWREFIANQKRLDANTLSLKLHKQSFDQTQKRYEQGMASLRDLLEIQEDLDKAENAYLESALDMIRSTVDVSRLDGSILKRHGFVTEGLEKISNIKPFETNLSKFTAL